MKDISEVIADLREMLDLENPLTAKPEDDGHVRDLLAVAVDALERAKTAGL